MVWELIRSGRDVHRMMPGVIETCRVEGSGPGARRYCTTKQGPLAETILCVEEDARPKILKAFNGETGASLFSGTPCGNSQKQTAPIAADGHVIVGADGKLCSYSVQP